MLGVQGLVDLIKQIERGGVTLLDGKNKGQSHQRLLPSRQLLHLPHLSLLPRERHLQDGRGSAIRPETGTRTAVSQTGEDCQTEDETDPDADSCELVDRWNAALGTGAPLAVRTALALVLGLAAFSVALLHHQCGFTAWHQLLENLAEVLRHLRRRRSVALTAGLM